MSKTNENSEEKRKTDEKETNERKKASHAEFEGRCSAIKRNLRMKKTEQENTYKNRNEN